MFDGKLLESSIGAGRAAVYNPDDTSGGQNAVAIQWKKNAEASTDPLTGAKDFQSVS
jgi:hypothetical protein